MTPEPIVYSFDVFDTCLVRHFARPTDAFYALAERVLPDGAGDEAAVGSFVSARVAAEERARRRSDAEDVDLDAIYRCFTELTDWGLDKGAAMQAERDLEIAAVHPIAATRRRIEALRARGARIVFVSDMYLGSSTIRSMLARHGMATPEDAIYVSSDVGLTKRSGRLYDHVLSAEGIRAEQLLHRGDDPDTDLIPAMRRGVAVDAVRHVRLNRHERAMIEQGHASPAALSALAGAARVARLSPAGHGDDQAALSAVAADIVAPLLTSYVAWVARDATERGIERLYFVSRDGQVLMQLAEVLQEFMSVPECRYLYGSRQAWFLPTLTESRISELDWLIVPGQSRIPADLIRKVGLKRESVEEALGGGAPWSWTEPADDATLAAFVRVLESPAIAAAIQRRATEARSLAEAYFAQEGMLDGKRWSLVDIGWTMKAQRSVRTIIAGRAPVHGYYLAARRDRIPPQEAGPYRAFVTEDVGAPRAVSLLCRNQAIVEQVFTMADHGSVRGYTRDGARVEPILAEIPSDRRRDAFLELLRRTVLSYARVLGSVDQPVLGSASHRTIALDATTRFLDRPAPEEARAVAWVPIGDDQNESRAFPLASALRPRDVLDLAGSLPSGAPATRRHRPWLMGSVALSGPVTRTGVRLAQAARHAARLHDLPAASLARLVAVGRITRAARRRS